MIVFDAYGKMYKFDWRELLEAWRMYRRDQMERRTLLALEAQFNSPSS